MRQPNANKRLRFYGMQSKALNSTEHVLQRNIRNPSSDDSCTILPGSKLLFQRSRSVINIRQQIGSQITSPDFCRSFMEAKHSTIKEIKR